MIDVGHTEVFSVLKNIYNKKVKEKICYSAKWIANTFEILKKVSITAVIW